MPRGYHTMKDQYKSDRQYNDDHASAVAMYAKMATRETCQHEYQRDAFSSGDTTVIYYQCIHCYKIVYGDSDPTETGTLKPGLELPL